MNKLLIAMLIVSLSSGYNLARAATEDEKEPSTLTKVREYALSEDVIATIELATSSPNEATLLLQSLALDVASLNYAEQYLILVAEAKLKQLERQHSEVISLIEQAKSLREHIIEKQLNLPIFSNAHLILANSYHAIQDYDNAYQAKKAYIDEYNDFSDANREITIKALTRKYEITHKIEANALLENQNKLKALRIADVYKTQQEQQQQFILIICTIILFVLLFLRQLKVRKKLLHLSKTDSLTGLINRATLFAKGQGMVSEANINQLDLSLLLFDIDYFKLINDEFGHQIGDLVLEKLALLVSETMRSRDVFARLGGEEFVVLLPNTDLDKAKAIAVRVMEKIANFDFTRFGVDRSITLSIGVATLKDSNGSFDDILNIADLAMYQAKAQGRNQMVSYDTMIDTQESVQR